MRREVKVVLKLNYNKGRGNNRLKDKLINIKFRKFKDYWGWNKMNCGIFIIF